MKDNAHRIMTEEAVKLLPEPCRAFFDRTFAGETALELIKAGAVDEDYAVEPLGNPQNILSGAWHESSTWEGWMEGLVSWFKENKTPWLEHYWSQGLGYTGLDNPVGITGLTYRAAPERAQDYWDGYVVPLWQEGTEASRALALGYLGRVIHLLQDMGTPAHVNNDCHLALDLLGMISDALAAKELGIGRIDDDDFEDFVGEQYGKSTRPWQADPHKQPIYYHPDWTLRDFNRGLAQVAIQYDSDDVDGTAYGRPFRWDSFLESSDPHRDITFDLTDYACNAIAANLIPMSISFVAGLMVMFLKSVARESVPEMFSQGVTLKKITVHDDTDPLASGEIYINAPAFGKRFGRYAMSDGESREISGATSPPCLVYEGQAIRVRFDVYDDDSWYFEPRAKESLGSVEVTWPPDAWQAWGGSPQHVSMRSSNGRCTLDFEVRVVGCQSSGGGAGGEGVPAPLVSMDEIIRLYPPLEFSDADPNTRIHFRHCHHLKRVEPENLRKVFLFREEFEQLGRDFRANPAEFEDRRELLEKLTRHAVCKTCLDRKA